MLLGSKNHTAGDVRKYVVDYSDYLGEGNTLKTVAVASSSTTATADTATILTRGRMSFLVHGGVLGEQFTVTVTVTTREGETVNDTVSFTVVAP